MATPDRPNPDTAFANRLPRLWALLVAARPNQVALILLVYVLGIGMATTGPPMADASVALSRTVALRVLGGGAALVAVAVTIHYANEFTDHETDALTERTPFSGGSGALVRTGLPPSFLRSATVAAFAVSLVAMAAGAPLGLEPDALAVLLGVLVFGLGYSLPPVAFVRRGVGEVVNAVLGGILLPLYGVAVVASPTSTTVLAVVPFTLLVSCNLLATHWPDRRADAAVGKRTLAVRWSPTRLRWTYVLLVVAAALATLWLWTGGVVPAAVALAHLTPIPFLVRGAVVLTRQRSPLPAVLAMVVLAVASAIAWWWVGVGGTV